MMNEKNIKKFIKSGEFQAIITLILLISSLIAFYISYRLAPLVQDLALVKAINAHIVEEHKEIKKDMVTRNEFKQIEQDIRDIKNYILGKL